MFSWTLYLVVAVVVVSLADSKKTEFEKEEGVLILNKDNYEKAVAEFEYLIVYFYAPWCGHCKALGPEFVKASQTLKEKDSPIKFGKVDGTEETEVMDRHGVTGYPTLKLYRKQSLVPYTGGRMAPEMVDWLQKKIGPPAPLLNDVDALDNFIKGNEVSVVGFFSAESPLKAKYEAACLDYDDYGVSYPVALTTDKENIGDYGNTDQIILFKNFDGDNSKVVYDGDYSVQSIRDFITENALPPIVVFNHANAQKIFKSPNHEKSHLLVFHNSSEETFQEETNMLRKVSVPFREQVIFVSVDVAEEDHRRMLEFLGVRHRINNDTLPSMRIITMRTKEGPIRYKPDDTTVSEENVQKFVQDYTDGKIPRHYFVEPLPKDWNAGPVKYLTAANLKESLEGRNALVLYYAPWCGHCKTLYPVWDEIGAKYEEYLVGKMDATVNEVEGHPKYSSFPTIKLYNKDGSQSEYNGERTVAGISKFIDTNGVYGMAAPDHDEL